LWFKLIIHFDYSITIRIVFNGAEPYNLIVEQPQPNKDGSTLVTAPQINTVQANISALASAGRRRRIFLPLFIATLITIVIGGGGFLIYNKLKPKPAKPSITTQSLSPEELDKLSKEGVAVGSADQSLIFLPLSVFKDKVGIDKELLVNGNSQIGGTLTAQNVTVNGDTLFNSGNFKSGLTVQGPVTLRNDLTLSGNLTVGGSGSVSGNFNVGGAFSAATINLNNLLINGHLLTQGKTPAIGRGPAVDAAGSVRLTGNDTAGTITIITGPSPGNLGTMADITFSTRFSSTPHVLLTPVGSSGAGLNFYADRGAGSFSIGTTTALAPNTQYTFDYLVTQ
jgi:hypothetical protein